MVDDVLAVKSSLLVFMLLTVLLIIVVVMLMLVTVRCRCDHLLLDTSFLLNRFLVKS
jgi:hypothetical protein